MAKQPMNLNGKFSRKRFMLPSGAALSAADGFRAQPSRVTASQVIERIQPFGRPSRVRKLGLLGGNEVHASVRFAFV